MADGGRAGSDGWAQDDRPNLSAARLVLISAYWLGIASIFAGLLALLGGRLEFQHLVRPGTEGSALLQMTVLGSLLALFVQPTIGTISDYTTTRWGRRRPYLVIGALLDVVFLIGIAAANSVVAIAAFFLALQLSSNLAQGPFQGFGPRPRPEPAGRPCVGTRRTDAGRGDGRRRTRSSARGELRPGATRLRRRRWRSSNSPRCWSPSPASPRSRPVVT